MLPKSFSERMSRLLGDEYAAFLASYERPRSVGLRMNPRKAALPPEYCTERVPWAENGYYYPPEERPGLSPLHDAGAYYLQEPSAMAPAALLDAQPGELVLDLCAAPGGKSTQIAAAMQGRGLLVCNEIHPKRARVLASNIERMGVSNALVLNEHPARLRFPRCFDRILVDAPCSGEGIFHLHVFPGGKRGRDQPFFERTSGFFRGARGRAVVCARPTGLDRGTGGGRGAHVPPLAAQAARRGTFCRRA